MKRAEHPRKSTHAIPEISFGSSPADRAPLSARVDHAAAHETEVAHSRKSSPALVAELERWLDEHQVHPDELETFMGQVATAVAFQGIVGPHHARLESSFSDAARRDLALIVAASMARQRRP